MTIRHNATRHCRFCSAVRAVMTILPVAAFAAVLLWQLAAT